MSTNIEASQKRKRGNSAIIPEATLIESAGPRSFKGRNDLISVILSNNVITIGEKAFSQ
jgi:hypothetical protein